MYRPPIVAILGHVDHGKTTLLDYIRKSNVATKEHGGITQSIGAYEIDTGIKDYHTSKITFIDTPGHEAFTKLRARGAEVADIVLLIVDAKDSVMPQTIESIAHIKAANIPYIIIANKIDLPDAKPEKIKNDLLKHNIQVESKGGTALFMGVSAKTGAGVKELLESILLLSSDLNLTCELSNAPQAYIIETKKDKHGLVVHAVIKDGTLHTGDTIYFETKKTKIRSLTNDQGIRVKEVVPSTPFELLGFEELPAVGTLISTNPEIAAKPIVDVTPPKKFSIEDVLNTQTEKRLSVILKADVQGSLEAILSSIEKNKNVKVALSGVGEINKSDLFLAKTTKSIVIGFNVKPNNDVADLAKQEKVVIKTYNIIYELLDELTEVSSLMKEKEENEKNTKGEAKIAAVFIIEKEKVFGIKVTKGKANIGDNVEVFRDKNKVGKTKIISLRQRAKTVEEVKKDQEAGMLFSPELDIKVGDVIKFIL